MAYFMLAICKCGSSFTCNPDLVPVEVKRYTNPEGKLVKTERTPLCYGCALKLRGKVGGTIAPGAYDPAPEIGDKA